MIDGVSISYHLLCGAFCGNGDGGDGDGGDEGVEGEAPVALVETEGEGVFDMVDDADVFALGVGGVLVEFDKPVVQSVEGVVTAHADVLAGVELGTTLPDNDVARDDRVVYWDGVSWVKGRTCQRGDREQPTSPLLQPEATTGRITTVTSGSS
jgi:hypothetical protein